MWKKPVVWFGLGALVLAGAIGILGTKIKQEGGEKEASLRSNEFVIAQERLGPPVSPADLDIRVAESDIVALEPMVIDRRSPDLDITLFEKPQPKTTKLRGMGHRLKPAQIKALKPAQVKAVEDEKDPEGASSAVYLGPTAGLRFSFDSTIFDDNATTTGGSLFIPPDSHAAAGPKHLVNVVNTTIRFHLKDGTLQFQDSLANFFAALAPLTNSFDPKVLYDQYARRFVVITLEQTDTAVGAPANTSRIFIAVSDDSDPNGTWFTTSINAATTIAGVPNWADYPGFAIDKTAIYIATNMFAFANFGGGFNGNRMWSIAKEIGTGFYSGGPVTGTIIDPVVPVGGFGLTLQPSHAYGNLPFDGTFLTGFSGLSNGVDEFFQLIRVENPLTAPLLDLQLINFGNMDNVVAGLPNAPQMGSPVLINTNDRRTLDAVWRDDQLYVTTTIDPATGFPDAGQATALWAQLDTSVLAAVAIADIGIIGGEDIAPQTSTSFASIAVNRNGDVAVGFSATAASIFASSYFTTRLCTDPAGTMGPSTLLRAGQDFYVRTFGGSNRWGDYSSVAVDPNNDLFWVYNEHALTRGLPTSPPLEDGRWGTAYGVTAPCVQTHVMPQNTWQFISLPCETRGATVANTFADDLAGTFGVDWFGFGYNPTTRSRFALTLNTRLSPSAGYFLRTQLAGQSVTVGDISNTKYGFKLAVNPGQLTLNMKGHPYPITACWADVLVIDGPNLLTLDQADPLIGGVLACDMVPPDPSCVMSRVARTWNGSSFDSIDGVTPGMQGTLEPFEGILIQAFKSGIGIRFSTVSNTGCGGPRASSFEQGMQNQAIAMRDGWYARVVVTSGEQHDRGAVFGQLPQSSDGRDATDLLEFEPFTAPYLSVGFHHDYDESLFNSDYRALDGLNSKDVWYFEVRGSDIGATVDLKLEGPDWLLANGILVDETAGTRHRATEVYSYQQTKETRQFAFYPK